MNKGDKVRYKKPHNKQDADRIFILAENPIHPTVYIEDENHTVELVTLEDIEVVP
jgi:hypothetical protein